MKSIKDKFVSFFQKEEELKSVVQENTCNENPVKEELAEPIDYSKFNEIWDAKKLIENICYYKAVFGNNNREPFFYDDDELNENERPSKRIIRKRIKAVLSAYDKLVMDLDSSLSYIVSEDCDEKKLLEVENIFKEEFPEELLPHYNILNIIQEQYNRGTIFKLLLDYRVSLLKMKNHWNGVLECNEAGCIAIMSTKNMFRNSFNDLDKKLEHILILLLGDDFERTFTETELIQQYDYPAISDKELQEMDIQWEVG